MVLGPCSLLFYDFRLIFLNLIQPTTLGTVAGMARRAFGYIYIYRIYRIYRIYSICWALPTVTNDKKTALPTVSISGFTIDTLVQTGSGGNFRDFLVRGARF